MNQDFALLATPENARRLLLLARICKLHVSDDMAQLATLTTISETDFDSMICPFSPVKQSIAQFLLDCQLRGIVQTSYHPEFNPVALLHTIKHAQPKHIIILSNRLMRWEAVVSAVSLRGKARVMFPRAISASDLDLRHNTVLVVDVDSTTFRSNLRIIAREFPQTIIYDDTIDQSAQTHWTIWAHLLFPEMPHPLYVRMIKDVPEDLAMRPLVDYAPFYNTCIFPALITDPDLLALTDDAHAIRSLSYYRGRLISER